MVDPPLHPLASQFHPVDGSADVTSDAYCTFGMPEELTSSSASEVISFTSQEGLDLAGLAGLPFVTGAHETRPGVFSISTTDALESAAALAAWRRNADVRIEHLQVAGATLEDVFFAAHG